VDPVAAPPAVPADQAVLAGYRTPGGLVLDKVIDHLDPHCREFIAHSPFATLATADADGWPEISPRGGDRGFVHVLDEHRLALPDRPGNNRVDSRRCCGPRSLTSTSPSSTVRPCRCWS
jgi:predicted pyridoxine 5'-phosphate oxidase superfamily flavin-nucleotide-binding protein